MTWARPTINESVSSNLEMIREQTAVNTIALQKDIVHTRNRVRKLLQFNGVEVQNILFQIEEDSPDILSIAVLFTLSLVLFTYASPRGYSETEFIPGEQWNVAYFIEGLGFEDGKLSFSSDYVSGRMMKAEIIYEPGGKVTLRTSNRARVQKPSGYL
jgi:hypothetical protein